MSDRELEKMRDSDFEAMLESSVAGLPPEDIVAKVTPWKKSVNRILIGIALTVIKLNFWYIDYILPAIGTIMMLLGFRTLRHENKWFGICFAVSVIRTAYFFSSLILNTTIIQSAVYSSAIGTLLTVVNILLVFIELICLWRSFISVRQKAGLRAHVRGAVALIVWHMLICLLDLIQYNGSVIGWLMIVGFFSSFTICINYPKI